MPEGIAQILLILQVLTTYATHLTRLIPARAAWLGFSTVAQYFGDASVPAILARIQRGLMRATALQDYLRQRAQRGRDLPLPQPAPRSASPAASTRPSRPPVPPDYVPTMQDITREVRRRPVGRTIAAICLDLGIAPTLCEGSFWSQLFSAIRCYRGSLTAVCTELRRRQDRFEEEDYKHPGLPPPERSRARIPDLLGGFIGPSWQPAPLAGACGPP